MTLRRIVQKLKLRYGTQETVINTLRQMGVRIGERCRIYLHRRLRLRAVAHSDRQSRVYLERCDVRESRS